MRSLRLRSLVGAAAVAAIVGPLAACSIGGPATSTGGPTGPIPFGVLMGFTGKRAFAVSQFLQGVLLAGDEIQKNGGVLGQPLQIFEGDTAADPVDAVPAARQLLTHRPVALIGPTSIEFSALQQLIDESNTPSFAIIPGSQFDSLNDPWVYDIYAADTAQAKAMAYYATQKGWKNCALVFDNSQVSQSVIPPLTAAFTKLGGTIASTSTIVTGLTSYRSEIVKLFAANPQCVFTQMDQSTAGTFFANARELGHLNVPFIGTDVYADPLYARAIGISDMSKWVTDVVPAPNSGATFDYFSKIFTAKYGAAPPSTAAPTYDATIVAALAMTAAGTTNPAVWINDVAAVTSEGGQEVTNYGDGVSLLKQGKPIDYEGASSPMDFDQFRHITGSYQIEQFDPSGTSEHVVLTVSAKVLEGI